MGESKATNQKAKALVDKYQKKTRVLLQGAEAEINSLPVAESSKRELLIGLKRGMIQTAPKLEEHWRLEAQIVEQYENIISLLAASKGWEVSGKHVLFAHTDELNRFNSYLASIKNLGQQEDQIEKDAAARTNDNLQSLKKDLAK